jgi:hypothetical protein
MYALISLRFPKLVRFVNSAATGPPSERRAKAQRCEFGNANQAGDVRRPELQWRRWRGCGAWLWHQGFSINRISIIIIGLFRQAKSQGWQNLKAAEIVFIASSAVRERHGRNTQAEDL